MGVQAFRPGVLRADVEAEQRKQRRLESRAVFPDEDGSSRSTSSLWEPAMDTATAQHSTAQNADGSFSQAGVQRWQLAPFEPPSLIWPAHDSSAYISVGLVPLQPRGISYLLLAQLCDRPLLLSKCAADTHTAILGGDQSVK